MRAVVLREKGGPEVLRVEDVPMPEPQAGEVLVKLHAAALNKRDAWIRQGAYAGLRYPIILGSDGYGEIVAVGPGVDDSVEGWRVVIDPSLDWGHDARVQGPAFRILGLPDDGTYAEYVRVPFTNIHLAPSMLSPEEAAAIPLAGLTAYRAVVTRGQAQVDEQVVVTGTGGGVATFALQMARYSGSRVHVTSGSDAKLARAQEFGAEGGVNYRSESWVSDLREMTEGGPHLIIDGTGGAQMEQLLDLVRPGGRIVSYGSTLGDVPNLTMRRVFWKQLTLMGTTMGNDHEFAEMLKWFEAGAVTPIVDVAYPLEQVADAHRRMDASEQFGKIVLTF